MLYKKSPIMNQEEVFMKKLYGVLLTVTLAVLSIYISKFIPMGIISSSVIALLLGMVFNPYVNKEYFESGIKFTSKSILKLSIILMGFSLQFTQVIDIGKVSLIVMVFTLITAFGGGYLLGRLFKMNWKLSSLISAGTGICGGSAVAAIAPTIEAEDRDVAYAISSTFIFDIVMVILFPIAGRYFGMSDLGYGIWTGTAVNDTSSVVAAGFAFSEAAGNLSIIVKLTRTLSIVPIVLIFSLIHKRQSGHTQKVDVKNIFPWFILFFIFVVFINSFNLVSSHLKDSISAISKFGMVMSLGAIGLNTNFKEVSKSGLLPMFHGFSISLIVVVVSFMAQYFLGLM